MKIDKGLLFFAILIIFAVGYVLVSAVMGWPVDIDW